MSATMKWTVTAPEVPLNTRRRGRPTRRLSVARWRRQPEMETRPQPEVEMRPGAAGNGVSAACRRAMCSRAGPRRSDIDSRSELIRKFCMFRRTSLRRRHTSMSHRVRYLHTVAKYSVVRTFCYWKRRRRFAY